MDKDIATRRLGGTDEAAARWLGVSTEIYREWPERLHTVMTDRVYAAVLRKELAAALGISARQYFDDFRVFELVLEGLLQNVSVASVMAHKLGRRHVPPEFTRPIDADDKPERRPYTRRSKPEQVPCGITAS